jgi:hypothetical protein
MKPAKLRLPTRPGIPNRLASGPNARLNPTRTQTTLTIASPKKLCMIVESTFLRRTRPP